MFKEIGQRLGDKFAVTPFVWGGTFLDWVLGIGLTGEGEKHAVREVVQLQQILFTEVLALVAFVFVQQNVKTPSLRLLVMYFGLSLVPIGGIFVMLRSTEIGRKRTYDRSTTQYARWALFSSLVLVSLVTYACWANMLPGQPTRVQIKFTDAAPYTWQDANEELNIRPGDRGVAVIATISEPALHARTYPDPLFLKVQLSRDLAARWEIDSVAGLEGAWNPDRPPTDHTTWPPKLIPRQDRQSGDVYWAGLQTGKKYTLKILLHSRGKVSSDPDLVVAKAKDEPDQVLTLDAFIPPRIGE